MLTLCIGAPARLPQVYISGLGDDPAAAKGAILGSLASAGGPPALPRREFATFAPAFRRGPFARCMSVDECDSIACGL